jgi:Alw26I/Eco31I/Esp3I family type II restriction endonuclease
MCGTFTIVQLNNTEKKASYGGRGRKINPKFIEYMKKVVADDNYKNLPWAIDDQQKIRWNAPSHRPPGGPWSNLHDERLDWWKSKAKELKIPQTGNWISKVAKKIHPFKEKPCQICGVIRSIRYEYPTVRIIKKINSIDGLTIPFEYRDFQTINQITIELNNQVGKGGMEELCQILGIEKKYSLSLSTLLKYLSEIFVTSEPKGILSPGAMSNAPDRLDGFHTFNICCRSSEDTGRNKDNLKTYGQDRRAFEFWCDGDWSAASRLMRETVIGKCANCGNEEQLTADHEGPISLGFCHRPKFVALCKACNSGKNNRMSKTDVVNLKKDEENGAIVVSHHAITVWDLLKKSVNSDDDALQMSKIMRANQHQYLMLLSKIKGAGHDKFLKNLLHPEYAKNRYEIIGFKGTDFSYEKLEVSKRQDTYSDSLEERMVRISLDALDEYSSKENRNPLLVEDKELEKTERELLELLEEENYKEGKKKLDEYMTSIGKKLVKFGIPRAHMKNNKKNYSS